MEQLRRLGRAMRSQRYFPLVIFLTFSLIATAVVFLIQTGDVLTIENQEVILRQAPDTSSQEVVRIKQHQSVHVIGRSNQWVHVRYRQREGWLPEWLLKQAELSSDQGLSARVIKPTSLYQRPSTTSNKMSDLREGYQYDVVGEANGWTQLVVNNQQGYAVTEDLQLSTREQLEAQEQTLRPEEIDISNARYLQVRSEGQAYHSEADLDSAPHYNPSFNQRFKYLATVTAEDGTEFYQVEDTNGQRGYLESRIVAFEDASKDHVAGPIANSLEGAVILLDAGHGGTDPGAVSENPYAQEKDITLEATNVLKTKLEARGAVVYMTRTVDTDVSLEDRARQSNDEAVDAFISIHFDEASDRLLQGSTTYYYHTQDQPLANLVNTELAGIRLANLTPENNGVHFGNYYVLRENHQPSLLLELGYMSNPDDLRLIQDANYIDQVGDAIVRGIENYLKAAHENQ